MRLPAPSVRLTAILAVVSSLGASSTTRQPTVAGDLVELDVVVVDRDGQPISGLTRDDFTIKEDGKKVDVKTFAAVANDAATAGEAAPRQVALLLDDSSVPFGGTSVVQAMAQAVLLNMRPDDEVTVVRLNNDRDEPFGDPDTAFRRIADYRAAVVPFQARETPRRVLQVLAAIARQFEQGERRRKLVVCIGGPNVCNVLEPFPHGSNPSWRLWVDALAMAARANVAVYAAMPIAPSANIRFGGGIVEETGGAGFVNRSRFDAFIDQLWRDAGEYYLLGYWPTPSNRELHSIDVKVERRGVQVRARRTR